MKITPPIGVSEKNIITRAGNMGSPSVRFCLGLGALSIEPFVDYYSNRKLDPETRKYSVVKTVLKIVVGTTTGVLNRKYAKEIGKKYLNNILAKPDKAKEILGVKRAEKLIGNEAEINKFSDAFGDFVGVAAAAIFSVCLDVPIINTCINKIMGKFFPHQANSKDIQNNRKQDS